MKKKISIFIIVLIILNMISLYFIFKKEKQDENINTVGNNVLIKINKIFVPPTFYIGLTNRISVNIKDTKPEDIILKIPNCTISKVNESDFEIIANKYGHSKLELYRKNTNGDTIKLLEEQIHITYIPDPTPYFKLSDTVSKEDLLNIGRVYCKNHIYKLDQSYQILQQTCVATIDNKELSIKNNSGYFSDDQKELIKKLRPGQHLIIKNIIANLPDGTRRVTDPLVITIKE
jgi:hypothetical protein